MAKKTVIIIGLITFVGLGIRLIHLNQSLWLDEAAQVLMSQESLYDIWFKRAGDFHPPLFYFLAHFWMSISTSEIWLRMLPIIFGVISIPLMYLAGKKMLSGQSIFIKGRNIPVGVLCCLLLSLSPFHVYYSQEFRSYSLLCLLGLWSMYAFSSKKYIQTGVVNLLILYTHYAGIFLIFSQCIFLLTRFDKKIKLAFFQLLIPLGGYVFWLPQLVEQMKSAASASTFLPGWQNILSISPLKAVPLVLFKLVAGRINIFPTWIYGVYAAIVVAVVVISLMYATRKNILLFYWTILPLVSMIVVSLFAPQTQAFRLIFILPGILISLALLSHKFPISTIALLVYISIVGNILYITRPRLQREQWKQASMYLIEKNQITLIKFPEPFAPLRIYAKELEYLSMGGNFPLSKNIAKEKVLSKSSDRIIVMEYLSGLTDPQYNTESALEELGYKEISKKNFEGVGFIKEYKKL